LPRFRWPGNYFYGILLAFFRVGAMAMPREANPLKTEQITLSLNAQTVWYLDRMVELGVYGNNRTEAARVAIYDHCKLLIAERKLDLVPPSANIEMSGGRHPPPVRRQ
jgi:hypothetical protein